MIDIHCHIIPNVDDGPQNIEQSIEMAKHAIADNIDTIVVTPHHLNGLYEITKSKLDSKIKALQTVFQEHDINIKLLPGMEIHLVDHLVQRLEKGEISTINNTKYILLELPAQYIPPQFRDEIFQLKLKGYVPILAHPERNVMINMNPNLLSDMVEWGVLMQVTSASIVGRFGPAVKTCAEDMLRRRLAHVIASDAHNSESRLPILSDGLKRAIKLLKNKREATDMVTTIPEKIINNEMIEIPEPIPLKKKFFVPFWRSIFN